MRQYDVKFQVFLNAKFMAFFGKWVFSEMFHCYLLVFCHSEGMNRSSLGPGPGSTGEMGVRLSGSVGLGLKESILLKCRSGYWF